MQAVSQSATESCSLCSSDVRKQHEKDLTKLSTHLNSTKESLTKEQKECIKVLDELKVSSARQYAQLSESLVKAAHSQLDAEERAETTDKSKHPKLVRAIQSALLLLIARPVRAHSSRRRRTPRKQL